MTQETAKERIYREAKKRIDMRKNGIHPSDYFEGWVVDYIDSVTTDKLSVEKLQEQLNTAKKTLTEIRANIEEHNQIYDLSVDTALLLEGIDGIAFDALAAIEKGENNEI